MTPIAGTVAYFARPYGPFASIGTPQGVRNIAATIYAVPMLAEGP